jgi:hypothetical protein
MLNSCFRACQSESDLGPKRNLFSHLFLLLAETKPLSLLLLPLAKGLARDVTSQPVMVIALTIVRSITTHGA